MYKGIAFLLFMTFSVLSGAGQGTTSLSDAINYALTNHPEVRVAQLNVKDAEWRIKENKATGFPQVSLGVNYSYFIQQPAVPAAAFGFPTDDPDQKLTFALRNNLAGKLAVNQLIFNNSYLAATKAAKLYRQYVELQLNAVKEKVRQSVRDAYLPALLITESVKVLDKNIGNQQTLLNETREIYKAGFVEQLDVDRLDLITSTLETERESLLRQRDILIDVLKFTMNMPVSEEIVLSDDMDQLLVTYADLNPDEALDYNNRPDYATMVKLRELNQLQVDVYDNDWLPTVNIFASYDPSFQGNEKLYWIPSAIAGISVSMPIYDSGLSKSKQERARIEAMKVDIQQDLMLKGFDLEIENARNRYKNALQKVEDQERNLALAQKINDTSLTKFRAGVGSSFEVTQAQAAYYQVQGQYVAARFELLNSIVALKKALGKI